MFKKMYKGKKGSLAVEAAIVFPIFFAVLITIVIVGLSMYQQTCARFAVDAASRLGQKYMANDSRDIYTGALSNEYYEDTELYRRFLSIPNTSFKTVRILTEDGADTPIYDSSEAANIKAIEDLARDIYLARSIYPPSVLAIQVDSKNGVIGQSLGVTLTTCYRTNSKFVNQFLGDPILGYSTTASATGSIIDGAEFVRNVDFISDMALYIPGVRNISNKYSQKVETVKEAIK